MEFRLIFFSRGVDAARCCMAAFDLATDRAVFPRGKAMRMTTINQQTKRPALGSCLAHGSDRLAKVWPISGRAKE
jgi:hypothetical protein